jgi:L-Ala-D/L-Glu epimerase / N-acetyl-D-glutamate racemase
MVDEAVLDAHDAMQAVRLRACDLINIKLMKCSGLLAALALDAVDETAGVGCQIGTMVESSVRLAVSKEVEGVTGRYFDGTREARANRQAYRPTG